MIHSALNTNLFLTINRFAQHTPAWHSFFLDVANDGIYVFALLLIAGWLYARRTGLSRVAAVVWAGGGALISLGLNQPIAHFFNEPRPYDTHHHILVLIKKANDASFPSDHGVVVGAVTLGLFLVNPILGYISLAMSLLLAFARVYVAAHYPLDLLAGFTLGAVVTFVGYRLTRKLLVKLFYILLTTPLWPLLGQHHREKK
ncbi:MAG TPA: phosphatase PAP2 family protein [Candidatus Saccharimonadales bacterium]|nr:phosphatase PAP2 family protein [Candidatus Saccharimonadales bacterium]